MANKKLTNADIQKKLDIMQKGQYELQSTYEAWDKKVSIICRDCGHEYFRVAGDFFKGKLIGNNCKHGRGKRVTYTTEDVQRKIDDAQDVQYEVIDHFTSTKIKITIRCRKCGFEYNTFANEFWQKRRIGKDCKHYHRLTIEEVQNRVDKMQNSQYKVSGFHGAAKNCKFTCRICGFSYNDQLGQFTNSGRVGKNCRHLNKHLNTTEVQKRIDEVQENQYELLDNYNGMIKKNKFKCRICGFEYYRRCVDMINKRIGKNCEHHKYNLIYVNSEQVQRALDTYQDGKYELIDEYDPEAGRKHKYKVLCRDCGFIYRSPLDTFLSKPLVGVNCEHKNRNNNTQELQSRIDKTQEKQYELIGPYKGSMVNHIFRCRKCGFEYFTISGPFLSHRIGENCKHKKAKYSQEEVQQLLDIKQEKQFEILTKYEGLRKKVWIRCRNCNLKYETTLAPYLRLRIGVNCQHHIKLTKARAIQRVTKISNGQIEMVGEFRGTSKATQFLCKICNRKWEANPADIFDGHGCPSCYGSRGEKVIKAYLKKEKYIYEEQYKIDECKDKDYLPFDFAVFNDDGSLRCLIEYQGIQHFQPIKFFGGEQNFLGLKHRDKIKKNFCKVHNISLIEIAYPQVQTYFQIRKRVKSVLDVSLKNEMI